MDTSNIVNPYQGLTQAATYVPSFSFLKRKREDDEVDPNVNAGKKPRLGSSSSASQSE